MKTKQKVIVILGQTATGKSDLAVAIAKKIDGEVISADSRQVYKGLNIGSGKITKKEMRGVHHHMLDIVNPKNTFSVSQFKDMAEKKIIDILKRGKTPILCGGTGFYIDAITKNTIFPEVPPNKNLRKKLEKETTEQLFKQLQKLDSARAKNIDSKNKVRLIRSIEIALFLGKVPKIPKQKAKYNFQKIGLYLPKNLLEDKIKNRLSKRIKKGMLAEVKNLHTKGVSWNRLESFGLEYKYIALYLQKKLTKHEMLTKLETEIYHYAKRQWTWFKRDQDVLWFEGYTKTNFKKICAKIK
ncbi:MAG: tRNA (adenosine(37)-N6)-dimethylallyltransferase MiaA [Candidatus Pacebacteria bacterium]|nr:tRNA (adenosine(37)-N6)-dimethylallyltransferase MiaA [Candidatus Paceibacterota bacterium]MCF7862857.1 tRNA (adenosine(37)-N6)-dimethylallyltransferase MiaA [Candidatus Paceibacterota bacterium]